jgi:tetratricopeptide (TPR) repeat protein
MARALRRLAGCVALAALSASPRLEAQAPLEPPPAPAAPDGPPEGATAAPASPAPPAEAPPPAAPSPAERAQALLEVGLRHYAVQEYARAVEAFKAGYLLDARPELLYALGQAYRLGGNCKSALEAYRAFLRGGPPEAQAARARQQVAQCEAVLEREAALTPPPAPPPAPPDSAEGVAPSRPRSPAPWYADGVAGALAGGGLVVAAVGVVLVATGEARAGEAPDAATYGEYASAVEDADTRRGAGAVALGVGGALIVGAVIRYLVVAHDGEPASAGSAWRLAF